MGIHQDLQVIHAKDHYGLGQLYLDALITAEKQNKICTSKDGKNQNIIRHICFIRSLMRIHRFPNYNGKSFSCIIAE